MAQKRKLNRGLEALLGSGLLAKGQEEVARAGRAAHSGRAIRRAAYRPADREPTTRCLSAAQGF